MTKTQKTCLNNWKIRILKLFRISNFVLRILHFSSTRRMVESHFIFTSFFWDVILVSRYHIQRLIVKHLSAPIFPFPLALLNPVSGLSLFARIMRYLGHKSGQESTIPRWPTLTPPTEIKMPLKLPRIGARVLLTLSRKPFGGGYYVQENSDPASQ